MPEIYIFRYHILFLESANIKHNTITVICLGKWNSIVSNKLGWSQIKHICRDLNSKAAGQVSKTNRLVMLASQRLR